MDAGPIYQLRPADVYLALESSPTGLTQEEVLARRALFGPNILTEEKKTPLWQKFLRNTTHLMALLLWGAGIMAILLGDLILGLSIFVLVLVNSAFSLWRSYRAEQAMSALRRLLPEYTRVLRESHEVSIPSGEIVPGDVLVLAEGDNIPADARVVEEFGLRANNATLTGEAVPSRKTADASLYQGISEVERPNLIFAGTSVASGTGRAVVFATGMLTQFGRIAHLTQVTEEDPSPIQVELASLTRKISLVAIAIGLFALLAVILEGETQIERLEAVLLGLGVIVATIPEGLPATHTLALALAGQRLALKGVLVKKLSVLETLGTVSTICTDKSGTLTQNQMTVREVWVAGQALQVSGIGYNPQGLFFPDPRGQPWESDLQSLLTTAWLCNNARLTPPGPGRPNWTSLGDQTEAALRVAALKGGVDESALAARMPRVHELPFDARRKRMTTIHQLVHPGLPQTTTAHLTQPHQARIACVKGAPHTVLQLCSSIMAGGEVRPLDAATRQQILDMNDEYAGRSLRVLAIARRELPVQERATNVENIERELTFLGLMAMQDPPRPEVTEAIRVCLQAGIRIVMITGDYGLTALSLARRIGLLTSAEPQIITGADLELLSDAQVQRLFDTEAIFARMAPEHKLRLVAALQARGEVVAVTGDGVNDAPALRKADIGVSMGIIGTDVAKEAADVILTNDNFATVVDAIREGRALYDNLRKFITYIFSSNVAEILPFVFTALFHVPLALRVPQILAIDLGTDILPALALGSEPPEPDTMQHPPRRRDWPVVDSRLLQRAFLWLGPIETALCFSGFILVYYLAGRLGWLSLGRFPLPAPVFTISPLSELLLWLAGLDELQLYWLAVTVYYAGVVMAQAGNAFACRAEVRRSRDLGWGRNRFLLLGVGFSILLLLALIYSPVGILLNSVPTPAALWGWLGLYGLILYSLEWIRKAIVRKIHARGTNNHETHES